MEISVQLYSVREALADDVQATLSRLVDLGLAHAEPYHLLEYRDELVRAREQLPIAFPSAHQSFLGEVDFPAVLEAAQAVGVKYLVDPFWNPADWTDAGKVRALAGTLTRRAEAAADVPPLLERLGERVQLVHLKDGDLSEDPAAQRPLGTGAMPLAETLRAAAGVAYGVIEFDDYAGDMFEGIEASIAHLRSAL